jgi:hypothetical protein
MTCQVLRVFTHEFNPLAVAQQDYEMAKLHHREVLRCLRFSDPESQRRFVDAQERLETAREAYLRLL